MGFLAAILDKFCEQCSTQSLWVLGGIGLVSFLVLSVLVNVALQVFFKNPNEPPVVFHWFPIIGSTVSYGIDPFKFFFNCREKVGQDSHR